MKHRHYLFTSFVIVITVIVVICLYFEINPFKDPSQYEPWQSRHLEQLEVGDIVFRTAYGKESRLIQLVSGGGYSHIAVVTEVSPEVKVTHATTNDDPDKLNQVLLTSITRFLSPTYAKTYLVARPKFLSAFEREVFAAEVAQKIGEPYLLQSKHLENLYCTTLLEGPLRSLVPHLSLQWQTLDLPGVPGDYLFPDAFLEIPGLQQILKDDIWLL